MHEAVSNDSLLSFSLICELNLIFLESITAAQFLASFPRQQLNGPLQVTVALHTSFIVPHLSFCAIGNDLQQPQLLAACVCMSSFGQCLHTIIKKSPKTRFKSMCS